MYLTEREQLKFVAQAIDWLDEYDKVVFCFDMDDVGRGVTECAALLTPGKAHIAELPLKDANDMLVANRSKELVNCLFDLVSTDQTAS